MSLFSSRLSSYVHGGFASVCLSLGKDLGLFDVFREAKDQPLSSADIAEKAGLKER